MSALNTVIFDFDGTLVDTFSLSVKLSNQLAPQYGYNLVSDEEINELRKLSIAEIFKHINFPIHKLPVILSKARKEMHKEIAHIKLFSGIFHMLDRLSKEGIRLGVVSSNSKTNVQTCLASNNVIEKFDFIHGARNLFGKHRTLKRLIQKLGAPLGSVIYVGDESRDIEASKKVNIPVVAVSWGFQDRERLSSMYPNFLADFPEDIEKFVLSYFKKNSSKIS